VSKKPGDWFDVEGEDFTFEIDRTKEGREREPDRSWSSEALDAFLLQISQFISSRAILYWNRENRPPQRMVVRVNVRVNEEIEEGEDNKGDADSHIDDNG